MAVLDSQTTDSEGKATLSTIINSKGTKTFSVTESTTGVSKNVEVDVINVDRIDISLSEEVVTKNTGSVITATAYSNENIVPNLKINIDDEALITDSEGKASKTYYGNEEGEYQVNVNTGTFANTIILIDAIQYFNKAEGKAFNLKYTTTGGLYVNERSNGLDIVPNPYKVGYITFTYPNATNERWIFTFDVVNAHANTKIIFGGLMVYQLNATRPSFKCEINQDGSMSVYLKLNSENNWTRLWDIPAATLDGRNSRKPMLGFDDNGAVIDNIKIYTLGELSP